MGFGTGLCRNGLRFHLLPFVLKTLLFGLILLVFWLSGSLFLNSLQWPVGDLDLGAGGVSYVELLILYELWAGERLSLEKAHPRSLRPGRPISVSAVPFGPGIDIWRSCRFIGALMRSLCLLLVGFGGLSRAPLVLIIVDFVTLVGKNVVMVSLLDHVRVLQSFSPYPSKSGRALLNGTLPLRYCAARFAYSTPTWRLPASGHVGSLVAAHSDTAGDRGDEVIGLRVPRVSGCGPVRKRFRLNRKTPAHLAGLLIHSRP